MTAEAPPANVRDLEERLSRPTPEVVEALGTVPGDVLVLGAGGKIGPSLARMARRAVEQLGDGRRVLAASRFSDAEHQQRLDAAGVQTVAVDLLDDDGLDRLPDVPNVIYLAGRKFGTSGAEHLTWAMNADVAARTAKRFAGARIVVFSTGNVYPLVPVHGGGAVESDPIGPVGEYAQSCLARERLFADASARRGTRALQFRLNYAVDLRYGVLLEVARAVRAGEALDVAMGNVNVIWQGDVNAYALRALRLCSSPPEILNVSGPETVSVRWLARRLGELLGREPVLLGEESATALLTNASRAHALFGYPTVPLQRLIEWTAAWARAGAPTLDKPSNFQERAGIF